MRKEHLLRTREKLEKGELFDKTDWTVLQYLVFTRYHAKWKYELRDKMLKKLAMMTEEELLLDEEAKHTALLILSRSTMYS